MYFYSLNLFKSRSRTLAFWIPVKNRYAIVALTFFKIIFATAHHQYFKVFWFAYFEFKAKPRVSGAVNAKGAEKMLKIYFGIKERNE